MGILYRNLCSPCTSAFTSFSNDNIASLCFGEEGRMAASQSGRYLPQVERDGTYLIEVVSHTSQHHMLYPEFIVSSDNASRNLHRRVTISPDTVTDAYTLYVQPPLKRYMSKTPARHERGNIAPVLPGHDQRTIRRCLPQPQSDTRHASNRRGPLRDG
jgi:hypothetical protein